MSDDDQEDTVRVLAQCDDHLHVERRQGGKVGHGVIRPTQEGKALPLGSELVELAPRAGSPGVFDVTSHAGPARVSSPKYRESHDRIFGKSGRKGPTDPSQLN